MNYQQIKIDRKSKDTTSYRKEKFKNKLSKN